MLSTTIWVGTEKLGWAGSGLNAVLGKGKDCLCCLEQDQV